MRYTKSTDGVMRATVRLSLRMSREEIAIVRRMAKNQGEKNWRATLEHIAWSAIEGEIDQFLADEELS